LSAYSSLDGLTHDRVSDIYTDSYGFVWVCTWYGVSRFDGYEFKNFGVDPEESYPFALNRFVSVGEDACSHLWFKTYDSHIFRFNRFTERFEDVMASVDGVDTSHYRTGLTVHDSAGRTWIAVQQCGLACIRSAADSSPAAVEAFFSSEQLGGDVAALHVDSCDRLWAATREGRISVIGSDGIRTLCRTPERFMQAAEMNGRVYFLSADAIVRIGETAFDIVRIESSGVRLTAMTVDANRGTVYVGGSRGEVFALRGDSSLLEPVDGPGRSGARIRDMKTDSRGTVWITTTEAGITRYDPSRGDFRSFRQEPYTISYNIDTLTAVAEGGGVVWIKMNKYGFGRYDPDKDSVEPFYNDPSRPDCRMSNGVVRFDVSQDGVLWFTTHYERGLRKAVRINQKVETIDVGTRLSDNRTGVVRAVASDRRGRIWVGTLSGEVVCYDGDRRVDARYTDGGRPFGRVYALKEDSRGNMWIGTRGNGLFRLSADGSVRHFRHDADDPESLSNDHIYCIEEDCGGRIWIATYGGGIDMLRSPDDTRFANPVCSMPGYPVDECSRVRYLLSDGPGRMFAATTEGLLIFDPSEDPSAMRFRLVQKRPGDSASLSNNDIIHLMKGADGRLWLSTYGGGVNVVEEYRDGEPRFTRYTTKTGLPSNVCLAAVEDAKGDVWISCENIVARLAPSTGSISTYTLYDGVHGAIFSEAAGLCSRSGLVVFAGGGNLYVFDPHTISSSKIDYGLRFTDLQMRNRTVQVGEKSPLRTTFSAARSVVLPYNYSNFRVEFASLNYALQDRMCYMYRLEGYDRDWNIIGKINSASFSNVPYGRYRLHVKAFVNSPATADDGISMDIVIRPPLWLTWWAKTLALLSLAAIALVVYKIVKTAMTIRREADMEQTLTDMKLQFFTNISHELRTPLTLILGGIDDVQKHDKLSPRGSISISLAQKNAKRLLALVNQLLDFRKIVKNKMELKISRVDLIPIVEDALDDFREMASARHIELLFTVSNRSILVWLDIERMESVMYNLLSNAMKFTPDGGRVEVVVSLREAEESVVVAVKDNGIGIPKDKLNTIFDRFVQGSRAVADNIKGSGIGLSLCREIVNLHHGEISVESRPGEGSTFTVRLRLGNSHFGMEQMDSGNEGQDVRYLNYMVSDYTSIDSQRRTDVQSPEGAPKILIVEDNRELRLFLYNSMMETYRVSEADDGVEALARIRSEEPDIIVTDLMMPNMDGIELINRIRHDFTMSHLPIIMLTAKHSPDDRIKAMEYGADGYITKPFSIDLLLARIDNLLTQRRALAEKFAAEQSQRSSVRHVIDFGTADIVVTDRDGEFLENAMAWIGDNIENSDLTIDQLASHLGMGRTTMYNKLKSLTGKSPVELIKEYRINRSRVLLQSGQYSVSEVAYKVGFSDPGYFSRCFREQNGMSPAEFLKSHGNRKQQ